MDGSQVIEVSIKQIELFSLISSSVSLVLGIVAIVLSILFYKMSERSAEEAARYSKDIDTNVKKLEILFDKLYDGTFTIMKDTVSDMRKYVYSGDKTIFDKKEFSKEIEKKTLEEVNKIVNEIKKNPKSDDELKKLIYDVIEESKKVEEVIKTNVLREKILNILRKNGEIKVSKIMNTMRDEPNLFAEMDSLAKEGIIVDEFMRQNGIAKTIDADAIIRFK